jgi:hypothetical protein
MAYKHRMDAPLLKSVNVVYFVGQSVAYMTQRYYLCNRNQNQYNSKTKKLWQQKSMQQTLM